MKKTASVLLCLALVWTGSGALAQYIMTGEEMHAIWQESFDKMNTEGALDIRTLDDLAAFEAEYTRRTGNERKEDLVFESLPMEGDMPYDEALSYARGLIADKFGTPESELDAMGVYPRLVDYIYMDHESEWEFYFTPRRDTDIHLDHSYDAPGEYRVVFGARTGTVEYVNWYLDGFFPHYALRTWEAGKYEYVYQKALGKAFYEQSVENQQAFERRFEEKGYDTAPIKRTDEELLAAIGTELMFAEPAENLLSSGDAQVEAALLGVKGIGPHYEIVVTRKNYLDRVQVKVELLDGSLLESYGALEELRGEIQSNIRRICQLDMDIQLVSPNTLKRFEGKARRVTDLRNQ